MDKEKIIIKVKYNKYEILDIVETQSIPKDCFLLKTTNGCFKNNHFYFYLNEEILDLGDLKKMYDRVINSTVFKNYMRMKKYKKIIKKD